MRRGIFVALGSVALILAIGETVARVSGTRPSTHLRTASKMGWLPAEGTYPLGGVPATFSDEGTRGAASQGGVLIFGDEIALGAGLGDDATVAAALRKATGLPVTLAACDRFCTSQELEWARLLVPKLQPKVVVFLFAFDDTEPFAATLFTSLRIGLQSVSSLAASSAPPFRPLSAAALQDLFDPDGVPWRVWAESTLPALASWAKETKTRVLFVPWPPATRGSDALDEYFEQVRGEALRARLEFVDIRPALGPDPSADRGPLGLPNAEVHRRVAAILAEAIR